MEDVQHGPIPSTKSGYPPYIYKILIIAKCFYRYLWITTTSLTEKYVTLYNKNWYTILIIAKYLFYRYLWFTTNSLTAEYVTL